LRARIRNGRTDDQNDSREQHITGNQTSVIGQIFVIANFL
jgi:hypothetical protein